MTPPDLTAQTIADRLVCARSLRHLNQQQLADIAGVPQSQISRIERAQTQDPGLLVMQRLCHGLGIALDSLVAGSMEQFMQSVMREPKPAPDVNDSDTNEQKSSAANRTAPHDNPEDRLNTIHLGTELGSRSNTPVSFDRWHNRQRNPHTLIFGVAGSGKTHLLRNDLTQHAANGLPFLLFDLGGSWTQVRALHRAERVTIGRGAVSINPLDVRISANDRGRHIRWLVEWLPAAMDVSPAAYTILAEAIPAFYTAWAQPSELGEPVLDDLMVFLDEYVDDAQPGKGPMLDSLHRYCSGGRHDGILNRPTEKSWLNRGRQTSAVISLSCPLGFRRNLTMLVLQSLEGVIARIDGPDAVWPPMAVYLDDFDEIFSSVVHACQLERMLAGGRKYKVALVATLTQSKDIAERERFDKWTSAALAAFGTHIHLRSSASAKLLMDVTPIEARRLLDISSGQGLIVQDGVHQWFEAPAPQRLSGAAANYFTNMFDELKLRTDLEQYFAGEMNVEFSGSGDKRVGLCPFHEESTPSLHLYAQDDWSTFHCFGCSRTGTIIDAVMEHKGFSMPLEAIVHLDRLYRLGLDLPGT